MKFLDSSALLPLPVDEPRGDALRAADSLQLAVATAAAGGEPAVPEHRPGNLGVGK